MPHHFSQLWKNARFLKSEEESPKQCSCPRRKKNECPLDNKCLEIGIIYQATVTQPNSSVKTYIGLTAADFKSRHGVHTKVFSDPSYCQTITH